MPYRPLPNYLRTARRRLGFSQDEIAFLLGCVSGTNVSRHETSARVPSISMVFSYEVIFSSAARDLFAGAYEEVRQAILGRAKVLLSELDDNLDHPSTLRKIEILRAIIEGASEQLAA